MRRGLQPALALLALVALQTVNGQQALSLGSAFPGDDSGSAAAASPSPAASTSPSPAASTSSSPAASTSPSSSPSPSTSPSPASPAASKIILPTSASPSPGSPSPTASGPPAAELTLAPVSAPAPAPGPAKAPAPSPANAPAPGPAGASGAVAGASAPGAAMSTGGGGFAPAPGPTAAPQINIVYIQQAGNARLTPSTTDPNSGVMSMNNALDTTLFDQDYPIRKLGKTSSQNFLNSAPTAGSTGPNPWFAPAPTAVLLGFNTSANVYILMALSQPVYNYTTATVNFNYLLKSPASEQNSNSTNGWLINLFINQPDYISGAVPMTTVSKEVTLFTPSLLTTIPCVTNPNVTKGSCTITNSPGTVCASAGQHGAWVNGTFCA